MGHGRGRWGDAVNELERVLGELDDRAKNGLTASKLIEAATADREAAGESGNCWRRVSHGGTDRGDLICRIIG